MNKHDLKANPIDAVILWVDGNDEKHRAKMLPYIKDKSKINSDKFRTRYDQVNEIKFTVDSILKYASFIRKIYIITDNQTPSFLENKKNKSLYRNVQIVDHSTILKGYEQYLPTFNSRTLETCIHRLPNLSEHFIYLNDDFFIIGPTKRNDFFTADGLPILRGIWQKFDSNKAFKKNKENRAGHKKAQEKAAKILGFKKLYRFKHTPHPIRKSTLKKFFNQNPELLKNNIEYKFRDKSQFLPVALANHLEIKNKTCYLKKDLQLLYFRSYKKTLLWYKFKLNFKTKGNLFLGLQSLDRSPKHIRSYILNWLEKRTS